MRPDGEPGALPETKAIRDAVRRIQHDVQRVSYLLSGDPGLATEIARSGIASALEHATESEMPAASLHRAAMLAAASAWLAGSSGRPVARATPGAAEQRYRVDDERSRMLAVLDMLSQAERIALVLHDYAAISVPDLGALDLAPDETQLRHLIEMARGRVRGRVDLEQGGRLHGVLARVSVDAPRQDLWPELESRATAMLQRSRRRQRRAALVVAAASIALLLIFGGWWLGSDDTTGQQGAGEPAGTIEPTDDQTRSTPSPRPTARPLATSPAPALTPSRASEQVVAELPDDLLLIQALDRDTESTYRLDLDAGTGQLIREPAEQRFLSYDGKWALDGRVDARQDGEGSTETVYRFQPVELPDRSTANGWTLDARVQHAALRDGRATLVLEDPQQLVMRVVQYDLRSGERLASVEVAPGQPEASQSRGDAAQLRGWIFAPAGSEDLFLITTRYEWNDMGTFVGYALGVYALDRDTLAARLVTERVQIDTTRTAASITGAISLADAHLLPDGSGIYAWHPATPDERASVRILDFASGDVEVIEAPFSTVVPTGPGRQPGIAATPSNDGERLYLVSAHSQEAAIVDLREREIERVFPIDLGNYPDAWLSAADVALSFTGDRLYIVESAPYPVAPRDVVPTRSTVWVLNLRGWQVVDRWELPTPVWDLIPAPAGDRLYISAPVLANAQHRQNSPDVVGVRLLAIDTEYGSLEASYRAEDLLGQEYRTAQFSSWIQQYRERFARTPNVEGQVPGDLADFATLPQVELSAGKRGVPVDTLLSLDVRLLDPLSGRPTGADVDSDAVLSLIFTHAEHNPVIALPSQVDAGIFRTTLSLPASGWWNARLVVDGERSWSVRLDDALYGAPTVAGSDGRDYYLALDVDGPDRRPPSRVRLGAQWRDAVTDAALPENVTLSDDIPESLQLSVVGANEGVRAGMDAPVMRMVAHGRYIAEGELWGPGPWSVAIGMSGPDGELRQIGGGRIGAVPAT